MATLPSARKSSLRGASLVVQGLRLLCASTAGDAVSIPGQGLRSHTWGSVDKKKSLFKDTYWRVYRWGILQRAMNSMLTDLVSILKAKGLYGKKSSRGGYKIRFVILEDHWDLSQLRQLLVLYSKRKSWITDCILLSHHFSYSKSEMLPQCFHCLSWTWLFWRICYCCRMSLELGLSDGSSWWYSHYAFWQKHPGSNAMSFLAPDIRWCMP